jgi:hypothetical protein
VGWSQRKLVVHAGVSKTGTTALQAFFQKNRPLFQSHGVFIPSYDGVMNHRLFRAMFQTSNALRGGRLCHPWGSIEQVSAFRVRTRATRSWTKAIVRTYAERPQQVLISSENFSYFTNRKELDRFLGALKLFAKRGEAIIYLRSPLDWFTSRTLQSLKRGVCLPPRQAVLVVDQVRLFSEAFESKFGNFPCLSAYRPADYPNADIRREFVIQHFPWIPYSDFDWSEQNQNRSISPELGFIFAEMRETRFSALSRHSRPREFMKARQQLGIEDKNFTTGPPVLLNGVRNFIDENTLKQVTWLAEKVGIDFLSQRSKEPTNGDILDLDVFDRASPTNQVRMVFRLDEEKVERLRASAKVLGFLPP